MAMPYRYRVSVHFGDKVVHHAADSVTPPEQYLRMLRTTIIVGSADMIDVFEVNTNTQLISRRDGKRFVMEAL